MEDYGLSSFSLRKGENQTQRKEDLCGITGFSVRRPPQSWRFDSLLSIQTSFHPLIHI